jgi:hypothetical protein
MPADLTGGYLLSSQYKRQDLLFGCVRSLRHRTMFPKIAADRTLTLSLALYSNGPYRASNQLCSLRDKSVA